MSGITVSPAQVYTGRTILKAKPVPLTADNVALILNKIMPQHQENSQAIDFLYNFYCGEQPIINRKKEIRPEIKNIVIENRAFENVEFKKGYEFSSPLQYTHVGTSDSAPVDALNNYARIDGKEAKDLALSEWFYISGNAYRICLPNKNPQIDDAPYFTDVLDPRYTFVVYANEVGNKPLLAGSYVVQEFINEKGKEVEQTVYGIYTNTEYFTWVLDKKVDDFTEIMPVITPNPLGMIPIVEYPLNESRLGYVEACLTLYNALNIIGSNVLDSLEQFVQSLLVFINCELPADESGRKIIPRSGDAIDLKSIPGLPADVKYLIAQLDHNQTQITKEDILNAIYDINGIPGRRQRRSGGDTGNAVELGEGWAMAEARAKSTEKLFKRSEMEYLKIVLHICRILAADKIGDLTLGDIECRFSRNRADNLQVKSTALKLLLDCGVAPLKAYEAVELFSDPISVWEKSLEWQQSQTEQQMAEKPDEIIEVVNN